MMSAEAQRDPGGAMAEQGTALEDQVVVDLTCGLPSHLFADFGAELCSAGVVGG
jgi:hypothetical protein